MPLIVKTKKILHKGKPCFRIVSFKGLKHEELPSKYTESSPYCFVQNNGSLFVEALDIAKQLNFRATVKPGQILERDNFYNMIKLLKLCGNKLHEINKENRAKYKDWKGFVSYKI